MQACLRAAHNAVRRALHAALDAAPCRRFAPQRLCIERRDPPPLIRKKGKILRRETIFDSTSEVMFNLLDFGDMPIVFGTAYAADPNQIDPTVGAGCSESTELRTIIPLRHCLDHRVTAPQP